MGFLPLTPRYTQLLATGGSASSGAGAEPADDPLATYAVFATVAFTLAIFLFKNYLSLRQRSTFHRTEFPSELSTTVGSIDAARAKEPKRKAEGGPSAGAGEEGGGGADPTSKVDRNAPLLPQLESKFAAAQSYGLDKVNFSLASSTYSTAEGVAFLLLGFMPYVWDRSVEFGARFFGWTERENEIGISLFSSRSPPSSGPSPGCRGSCTAPSASRRSTGSTRRRSGSSPRTKSRAWR